MDPLGLSEMPEKPTRQMFEKQPKQKQKRNIPQMLQSNCWFVNDPGNTYNE